MSLERQLLAAWQQRGWLAWLLRPLAWMYALVIALRRLAYGRGWLTSCTLPVPVVVIGNIIAGGSGKTPFTLWLAAALKMAGWQPGIISRGYGAQPGDEAIREVELGSLAAVVGDEPLLLKRRSGLPVFVGRDRVAAGQALLTAHPEVDLLLSDDGLQHYRLQRDVEIALIDARGLMNGWLLPAGPLREPARRLQQVDALILNGLSARLPQAAMARAGVARPWARMRLSGHRFFSLDGKKHCQARDLQGLKLAALAGMAVPGRFFAQLESLGLEFSRHEFPDHHRYSEADLLAVQRQTNADALLMTEKDAVKCPGFTACPAWVLPVTAELAAVDEESCPGALGEAQLLQLIELACRRHGRLAGRFS